MDWYTASLKPGTLMAICDGHGVVISGIALTPSPAYATRVMTLPMKTYPPEFAVEVQPPEGTIKQSMTELPFEGRFEGVLATRWITVYAADGSQLVPVHHTSEAARGPVDVSRATGYSVNFNFDEAFGIAVAQITAGAEFNHIRVVEVGATTGTFPFKHQMYVTVERC
jgi:hypothetical protein